MQEIEKAYTQHAKEVYRYLLSLSHSEDLAEELTQETFFRAMRTIHSYDGSCKLSVWLCQIAKHLWYQHLRKRQKETVPLETAPETPVPSAEDGVLDQEGRLTLLRQIHRLPEPQREVIYLRAFGNLSFREIGDVLGKTENWTRVTFYRTKEKLRNGGASHEK